MRHVRILALLAALALVAAACGDDDGETTTETSAATSTSSSESTSTTEAEVETVALSVYFLDADGHIRVGWVRDVEGPEVAKAVLESLLDGPNGDDGSLGLVTAIPQDTELLGVDIADGTGVVDLSEEFATGGGEASAQQRLAQVVYAMTQFPTVDEVEIRVDGEAISSVGDAGVAVDGPLVRADFQFGGAYQGVEDAILVETPRPGETIEGTSVDVGGSANTFEATVNLEGVDAESGEVVVPEEFTTASSGSGTPGVFTHTLEFPEGMTGDVIVRVFENSPEDGSRESLTEIPLTLE